MEKLALQKGLFSMELITYVYSFLDVTLLKIMFVSKSQIRHYFQSIKTEWTVPVQLLLHTYKSNPFLARRRSVQVSISASLSCRWSEEMSSEVHLWKETWSAWKTPHITIRQVGLIALLHVTSNKLVNLFSRIVHNVLMLRVRECVIYKNIPAKCMYFSTSVVCVWSWAYSKKDTI